MTTASAVLLGIVQGLTEFLPVSSSGHLVLFQQLLGFRDPPVFFDICVHVGTLAAVFVFFREDISAMLRSVARLLRLALSRRLSKSLLAEDPHLRMALMIVIGSIPTAILGLLFKQIVEELFASPILVGLALLVTGALLWTTRRVKSVEDGARGGRFTVPNALLIGLVQGIAIIPGISRSGSTISAGLLLGLERETAARFSFLLSVPAILGATLLGVRDAALRPGGADLLAVLAGAAAAAGMGYLALRALVPMVRRGRIHLFAPYCWLAGLLTLVLSWS
jgi:undecaprenyl-diphosphatase